MKVDFISRFYFIFGLCLFLLGQILLRNGNAWVKAQAPIDYAHWCLLIGALFLLPLVFKLPRNALNMVGAAVMVIGVAAVIGMCVLDFIFWSLPSGDMHDQWATHLINTSAIWKPFITIGPNYIFGAALVFPALAFWKNSKIGVALVLIGTAIIALLYGWWNVLGYTVLILGYLFCFDFIRFRKSNA